MFIYFFEGCIFTLIILTFIYFYFFKPVLNKLKDTDSKTGLLNHNYLQKYLSSSREKLYLILIDIDNFKKFNSEHGYAHGDEVILLTKKVLSESAGQYKGLVFRYRSGDEFLLSIPQKNISMADLPRLVTLIAEKLISNPLTFNSTASFGITVKDGEVAPSITIVHMEKALITAKSIKNSAYYLCIRESKWVIKSII